MTLRLTTKLRTREDVPDLWLLFAPIKKGPIDWLVEKATELGAARLQPVVTQRTIVDRLNLERLRANMIEAAEQCDRTAIPVLSEPAKLPALLKSWNAQRASGRYHTRPDHESIAARSKSVRCSSGSRPLNADASAFHFLP